MMDPLNYAQSGISVDVFDSALSHKGPKQAYKK